MGTINKVIEKYGLGKWFKRDNLLILVLAGILMVIIVLPLDEEKEEIAGLVIQETQQGMEMTRAVAENEFYEYATYLEQELEDMLSQMKGVGKVAVMITLEGSGEVIVHQDETIVSSDTTEMDSQGGSRTVHQNDLQGKTVYAKDEQGESPYVVQTKLPKVSGVLIVAEGAGDGSIRKSITQIAEALLDVEVHKVTVVAME